MPKTRMVGTTTWSLLDSDIVPQPAHKLIGIPIGDHAACTRLLLERFAEVADFP